MPMFTVWVQQDDREGTMHISSHEAADADAAEELALDETAADWDWDKDALIVIGVAAGEVSILSWNDDC